MDDLKFALVGCGRISRKHVDAIGKTANAKLVAGILLQRHQYFLEPPRDPIGLELPESIS